MLFKTGISGLLSLIFCVAQAQNLKLVNQDNRLLITNDTIVIQSTDNAGWVGYESLDLRVIVSNTGPAAIEVGVKKVEYEILPASVQHTICFAGQCYDVSTYVSPSHITLGQGEADSGFIAHYLFDNITHVRGINQVAYVFYDVNHPSDSVFVHVIYNTVVPVSVKELQLYEWRVYPVPATTILTVEGLPGTVVDLRLTDMAARTILRASSNRSSVFHFPVDRIEPGFYLLHVKDEIRKIIVQ